MLKRMLMLPMLAAAMCLTSCAPLLAGLTGLGSGPPAQVQHAAAIARGPIDFALHAFDASLYAFDLAMDVKHPAPGSPEAKRLAALGRKVLAALSVADAAQKAGAADTYAEAFANANTAFNEFRSLLGVPGGDTASLEPLPRFTPHDRLAILARADRDPAIAALVGG